MILATVSVMLSSIATPSAVAGPAPADRILWRFETQGSFIHHRPAVAPGGTIVFMDNAGTAYALNPDGSLLWLLGTGGSGWGGPVSIAADGTIYVTSDPAGPDLNIIAISPSGDELWTFTDQSQKMIAGPGVGPDGNVYVVDDTPGLGAFSLTPAGDLRWNNAGFSDFGALGTELAFGLANGSYQVYLCANGFLTAMRLDGNERWQINVAPNTKQVAVGMNGDVYCEAFVTGLGIRLRAYDPKNGDVRWSFFQSPTNSLSAADVGPDGSIYIVRNLNQLHAINPNGTARWNVPANGVFGPVTAGQSPYHGPIVSPDNEVVLLAGLTGFGGDGIVRAFGTDGDSLWVVPLQDGDRPNNRPRFNEDGSAAYIAASNDTTAFLYAIRVADEGSEPIVGDLNGDGVVNVSDLLILFGAWGECPKGEPCLADLNGDGTVNVSDLLTLLGNWG